MKRSALLLGGVAAFALCGQAQAGEMKGWYVSLEGGANWVNDLKYQATGTSTFPHTHIASVNFDTGWAILASVGYGINDRWRVELEGGYRYNKGKNLFTISPTSSSSSSTFTTPVNDKLREFSLMANVMYDYPLTSKMSLTLGAGVGADHAKYETRRPPSVLVFGEDESWNFAYQGIVGLNYDIGSRSQLFLRYRYLGIPDPEFRFATTPDGHTCCFNVDDIEKQTATIGFRFFFAGPPTVAPPPETPPPEVPPPTAKQFIIFFGFDKCNITAEADRVLSDAASTAKSSGSASVRIVGHTDSSGSAAYNQRLSNCRATATKNNIASKGVPAEAISSVGRGESELLVQTGDGVKEPQNRRATVDLE
jgi:OmpA-OmpF porin, OOP family